MGQTNKHLQDIFGGGSESFSEEVRTLTVYVRVTQAVSENVRPLTVTHSVCKKLRPLTV